MTRRKHKKDPLSYFITTAVFVFWSVALFVVLLRLFPNVK